jgi:endoglucanase
VQEVEMNDDQRSFLVQLVGATGPSGYEAAAQEIWRSRVSGVASVRTDTMGNAVASVNPDGGPRIMLEAHIDEIGFQVKYIDDNGFLYFNTIGGFDPATLAGNRVRILGKNGPVLGVIGRKPAHLLREEDRKAGPKIKDMWIDIGARNADEARGAVAIGDAGGRVHEVSELLGTFIASNSFDDRVGSYVIAEALLAISRENPSAAVFVASAVQEEIGLRGAGPVAYGIDAPIGVAVDVTFTSDHPETRKTEVGDIRCGAGPVLTRGAATNARIFERLVQAAEAAGVTYQIDANPTGRGTDQHAMQVVRSGMATGLVSIPTRYLHTASEVLSTDDVDGAVAILTRFVLDMPADPNLTP